MKKISYGFLTISLMVLLGSCSRFKFPEGSRFIEGKIITTSLNPKNERIIVLKKDSNTIYSIVDLMGGTFTYNKFIIKEINLDEVTEIIKYETRRFDEVLLKAYIKNSYIHLFSSLKAENRLFVIQRTIDTKDNKVINARVVYSVASLDEVNDKKESDIQPPDKDIIFNKNNNTYESIIVPIINASPDTSKISIVSMVKQDIGNTDLYGVTIDLVNNSIKKFEKSFIKPQIPFIYNDATNEVMTKGLVNNDGSTIIPYSLWEENKGIKTFNLIEIYNGEINDIQIDLWDSLNTVINDDDIYIKDYSIFRKSDRVYEFIGLIMDNDDPKSLVKIEYDFNKNQVHKRNYIIFDDSFKKKFNEGYRVTFNHISNCYYHPNGDLIIGFEKINMEDLTKAVFEDDFHAERRTGKKTGEAGFYRLMDAKKVGDVMVIKDLFIGNFGKEFSCKWLNKDNNRNFRIFNDYNMDDVKAIFYPESKNVKFDYINTYSGFKFIENEVDVETGALLEDINLIICNNPFRTSQRIQMKKNTTLNVNYDGSLILFTEKSTW